MSTPDHRVTVAAQRRERMRARLISAAYKLAAERGIDAVTIDAVILRAEVSRGTFYKYFDTPLSLLQAVGHEVSDSLLRTMRPVVGGISDPAKRIAIGTRTVLYVVKQHPSLGLFFARSGWPAADLTPTFHSVVGETLKEGLALKRFGAAPLELAISLVAGTLVGAMHAQATGAMPDEFPELTAAAILRALGVPSVEARTISNAKLPLDVGDFMVIC